MSNDRVTNVPDFLTGKFDGKPVETFIGNFKA